MNTVDISYIICQYFSKNFCELCSQIYDMCSQLYGTVNINQHLYHDCKDCSKKYLLILHNICHVNKQWMTAIFKFNIFKRHLIISTVRFPISLENKIRMFYEITKKVVIYLIYHNTNIDNEILKINDYELKDIFDLVTNKTSFAANKVEKHILERNGDKNYENVVKKEMQKRINNTTVNGNGSHFLVWTAEMLDWQF